jgi:uncharacterized caspase-like protein
MIAGMAVIMRGALGIAALAGWVLVVAAQASAEEPERLEGVALIIGQSAYEAIDPLPNPVNDAREMAKILTDLGFDARSVTDRDGERLRRDLERFVEDAAEADVAFLYYSGHGIEAGGENWLIPVDAGEAALADASSALVSLTEVIAELKASVPVAIVLLDACRTSPFPAGTVVRADAADEGAAIAASGLGAVRGAVSLTAAANPEIENLGTVIGFAAEPGLPALDGEAGGNSPYAAAILRHLAAMPGTEFGSVMRMVTEEVYLATGTRQRPWVNESLRRQLYFGSVPDEPEGEEGLINGERRKLLLTISELPDLSRVQVERVAARDGVPLDALYGILRALGQSAEPSDPAELERLLEAQAERLRAMLSEREALRSDDPEIARLSAAADRAIAEGAIETARIFMDQAVARVEETADQVDDLEAMLRDKRVADAGVYAKRAAALSLAFDFRAAAADYATAHDLVEKWDEKLAWNYKNLQAEALRGHGEATGDRAALNEALQAYEVILRMLPGDDRGADWARTRNNMAVVLNTLGERSDDAAPLDEALVIFEEAMAVFAELGDDVNWSAAQNNRGNILLLLGGRDGSTERLEQAVEAFRAALGKRPRDKVPMEWAASHNNLGITLYRLAERSDDVSLLEQAEAAYRAALEVFTREGSPVDWGMTSNNLGNTLNSLGLRHNDIAYHRQAAEAFEASLQVRTREHWPLHWAATQLNLGNAYSGMARHDLSTENLERARSAYEASLTVFTRRDTPLDWASAQNNLGSALQTIGQRNMDLAELERASAAFQEARQVYRRRDFPLDWAMTQHNIGNTLMLMGGLSGDVAQYRAAVESFRDALREYTREQTPMYWANSMASMGSALQALSNNEEGLDSLTASIEARRAALEILTVDNAPVEWANAQNGIGTCLLNLANRTGDVSGLEEARAAFEASMEVFTRESQPLQWAFAQNNIGDIHWSTAAMGGDRSHYATAVTHFETAKAEFERLGFLPIATLAQKKIDLIAEVLAE